MANSITALDDNHNDNTHWMMRNLIQSLAWIGCTAVLLVGGILAVDANPQQAPGSGNPVAVQPQEEPTIRVDVDLVNVLFAVRAKKGGALIPNLEKSDFRIYEDAKEQKIQRFSRETDLPLTLGLLIDISASQENLIDIEREAASSFFSSVIRPKDEAFLISFGKSTELLQDYTNSARQLRNAMNDLRGDGSPPMIGRGPIPNVNTGPIPQIGTPKGTLLFDAIYLASNEKLKNEVGRKAIVLITDGEDQGSFYTRKQAIEAAQRADAIIYSIYYVDRYFYSQGGFAFGSGGEGDLRKMSDETGGHVFVVDNKHSLQTIFKELQDEMRNQYAIGYTPSNSKRDGTFRRVEIKTNQSDYKVQARNGYYATKNDGQ